MKRIIPIMVIMLLVSTSFVGVGERDKVTLLKKENCNYDIYDKTELSNSERSYNSNIYSFDNFIPEQGIEKEVLIKSPIGLMNSSWPMYCHDKGHTGRSPFSTDGNTGAEKWRYDLTRVADGDVVIGDNDTICFGANGLYAMNSNGTLKWEYITHFTVDGAPAIAEDGTIYFGTIYGDPGHLYALNPNGTLNWKFNAGSSVFSSPVIGDNDTIYFGSGNNYIYALWSNKTIRWKYKTDHVVYSSPAIGQDGTIYCGSHDTYLYALYPNNGTLKWKYKTGDWIRTSPCIGDDGTIYVVSLDYFLHAVNPDGSFKWKTNVGAGTSPTIGQDGTIYCGSDKLHAIYPNNGSVRWSFDNSGDIRGGTPCNSIDGSIYFGTDSGWIYSINTNGTMKWRKKIGECESAPAIGENGTIYVGASTNFYAIGYRYLEAYADSPHYCLINESIQFNGTCIGGYKPYTWYWDFGDNNSSTERNPVHIYSNPNNYTITLTVTDSSSNQSCDTTWAWIQASNDPPDKTTIIGETNGKTKTEYDYSFLSSDPEGLHIWYYIEWDDGTDTGWIGPYKSGKEITLNHQWSEKGEFIIRCKAKDPYGYESEWATIQVTMPYTFCWPNRLLGRFPLMQRFLGRLIL